MTDNWTNALDADLAALKAKEAEDVALKAQADAIAQERRKIKADADAIRGRLKGAFMDSGVASEDRPLATISIAKGRQSLAYADSFDPSALDVDFVRIKREPDAALIKSALAKGESIPGVSIKQGAPILTIKFKENTHG
ncbi:MAG: siphovirus Gp157 family protein [Pseudomonadota bacterium]